VTLEPPRIRRCANHCDFCFVDGNPDGLRTPLYIGTTITGCPSATAISRP